MIPIPTTYGTIREWIAQDATALVRYANNRHIWQNLRDGFPHPYTPADAASFLAMVRHQDPATFFALATPGEAIGGIGIALGSDVHCLTAELGYWLGEPFWGRGIMTETVRRFTGFVFEHFDVVRIHAEPYAYNPASCRVLEKAGFVLEGRMRSSVFKDGQIADQFLYALLQER
jgi:RimJ/RimL family protein N-acetyltransferase